MTEKGKPNNRMKSKVILPDRVIDPHLHILPKGCRDAWMEEECPNQIRMDLTLEAMLGTLADCNVQKVVLVQCRGHEEHPYLKSAREAHPDLVLGYTCYIDLKDAEGPGGIDSEVEEDCFTRAFRDPMTQGEDPSTAFGHQFSGVCARLAGAKRPYEMLGFPKHLQAVHDAIAGDKSGCQFILDHLCKMHPDDVEAHGEDFRRLGELSNLVACKLSGYTSEILAKDGKANPKTVKALFDLALETFGVDRLMWASNHFVCTNATSYHDVLSLAVDWARKAGLSDDDIDKIFFANAERIYGANTAD